MKASIYLETSVVSYLTAVISSDLIIALPAIKKLLMNGGKIVDLSLIYTYLNLLFKKLVMGIKKQQKSV